jgi:hypothetical protein
VDSIGDHCLRIEGVTTYSLGYRHAQVGIQTNSGDAHTGIIFVR